MTTRAHNVENGHTLDGQVAPPDVPESTENSLFRGPKPDAEPFTRSSSAITTYFVPSKASEMEGKPSQNDSPLQSLPESVLPLTKDAGTAKNEAGLDDGIGAAPSNSRTAISSGSESPGIEHTSSGMKGSELRDAVGVRLQPNSIGASIPLPSARNDDAALSPILAESRLRNTVQVLSVYCKRVEPSPGDNLDFAVSTEQVVEALRNLAETMVWADQHDPSLWESFLEFGVMPLLVQSLQATLPSPQVQGKDEAELAGSTHVPIQMKSTPVDTVTPESQDQIPEEYAGLNIRSEPHVQAKERFRSITEPAQDLIETGQTFGTGREKSAALAAAHSTNLSAKPLERTSSNEGNSSIFSDLPKDNTRVQSQVLQSLSIMVQSVSRQHSLLCIFSSNHINNILSFQFDFSIEEMLAYFMSAVKTISLKLDPSLLQLFFDPNLGSFPLYSSVVRFFDHHEAMVRIAVRNVSLTIYDLGDTEVLKYSARDSMKYIHGTVDLLAKLCGSVARSFELLLDDGKEVRRTRSRTGIFRRRVRVSEVTDKLEEIENLCGFLGDAAALSIDHLYPLISNVLSSKLFGPLFRPLSSMASPTSIRVTKRWRISKALSDTDSQPALAIFDAAARCLVLAFVLNNFTSTPVGRNLAHELIRPNADFEHRNVLHGLKAIASDISGTERVTFVSLCAVEAFIHFDASNPGMLHAQRYDFELHDLGEVRDEDYHSKQDSFLDYGTPGRDDMLRSLDEPMLMTLSGFEAPLTPTNSAPATPTAIQTVSDGNTVPIGGLSRAASSASMSSDGGAVQSLERSDSDGILTSFQLGEASLREALSSIALVVRRREVRTLRVMHAIVRTIFAVGMKTKDFSSCVDVSKIILDEMAGVMAAFLKNKMTTIVSIELMFENFRAVAESDSDLYFTADSLERILSPDTLPSTASQFPKGAGKRRRAVQDDCIPPIEIEDATFFFVMVSVYEECLRRDGVTFLRSLHDEVRKDLLDCDMEESYLDKRDALEEVTSAVLKHGESRQSNS